MFGSRTLYEECAEVNGEAGGEAGVQLPPVTGYEMHVVETHAPDTFQFIFISPS